MKLENYREEISIQMLFISIENSQKKEKLRIIGIKNYLPCVESQSETFVINKSACSSKK